AGRAGGDRQVASVPGAATIEGAAAMIDEEIREALDVDPSPEFLARVRARVAAEPAPSTWQWSWAVAAACGLAAAVVLGTIVSRPHQARLAPEVPRPSHAIAANNTSAAAPAPQSDAGPQQIRTAARHVTSVAAGVPESEPEILIDVREMQTLRRLIAGV